VRKDVLERSCQKMRRRGAGLAHFKVRAEADARRPLMTVIEAAERLNMSPDRTRRHFAKVPGVLLIRARPGAVSGPIPKCAFPWKFSSANGSDLKSPFTEIVAPSRSSPLFKGGNEFVPLPRFDHVHHGAGKAGLLGFR